MRIRLPLNAHVTINLTQAGATDPTQAIGDYLRRGKRWLRSMGAESAHLWVQEWAPIVGQHVHIALHVPPQLWVQFFKLHRRWLKQAGLTRGKGRVKSGYIGKSKGAAFGDHHSVADYRGNLARFVNYLLKEVQGAARQHLEVTRRGHGGVVHGKRSSTSQNISRAARWKRGRYESSYTPWMLGAL